MRTRTPPSTEQQAVLNPHLHSDIERASCTFLQEMIQGWVSSSQFLLRLFSVLFRDKIDFNKVDELPRES
jgi:hypothetical protein